MRRDRRRVRPLTRPLGLSLLGAAALTALLASLALGATGDGRLIRAPKQVQTGEPVTIVAISLKPSRYTVDLVREIPARHLKCTGRVARARRTSGTTVFEGRIPTRFRCYSSVKKAFVSPIAVTPGKAQFLVHAALIRNVRNSIRFQTTTVTATPRFTG